MAMWGSESEERVDFLWTLDIPMGTSTAHIKPQCSLPRRSHLRPITVFSSGIIICGKAKVKASHRKQPHHLQASVNVYLQGVGNPLSVSASLQCHVQDCRSQTPDQRSWILFPVLHTLAATAVQLVVPHESVTSWRSCLSGKVGLLFVWVKGHGWGVLDPRKELNLLGDLSPTLLSTSRSLLAMLGECPLYRACGRATYSEGYNP